ncbi:MAG: hypothetical protein AAFX94_17855, partial [Myxococcota bacterium]
MRRLWIVAVLAACTNESENPLPSEVSEPVRLPESQEPPDPQPVEGDPAFITVTAAFYRTASQERRVQVEGKKVSNYLATLYRGESV